MSELSTEERCKLAAHFIEQAPPGEVNDVLNDIRAVIADDQALMPHVLPALRAYNVKQLQAVEHPAVDGQAAHVSLLSQSTVLVGSGAKERFVDAVARGSFLFDHINSTVSDPEPYELPEQEETFRSALQTSLSAYVKNHFASGYSSVSCSQHPLLPPSPPPPAAPEPVITLDEPPVEPVVSDVILEQVGSGGSEPAPTPAVGDVNPKTEEVDQPGGLEKVDEKIEEVKEEEEAEERDDRARRGPGDATEAPVAVEVPILVDEIPSTAELQIEQDPPAVGPTTEEASNIPAAEPQVTESETVVPAAPALAASARIQERVENPTYSLEVVGTKFNPSNFWTGRWRQHWVVDPAAGSVSGTIHVDVHYFEQGNVQLAGEHTASFPCPTEETGSQSIASQIVTTISKIETNYHMELNDVYGELGDKAFRALRRALPVTRQKMEWEKVSGYNLSSDLTKARA